MKKVTLPKKEGVATKNLKNKLIELLKELPIATYAYQKSGVPKSTYYKWKNTDEEFRQKCDSAITQGKMHVNDIAKSQLVKLIQSGNLTAIIFWLKHQDRDFNQKLVVEVKNEERYSEAEIKLLSQALFNMGYHGAIMRDKELKKHFEESEEIQEYEEKTLDLEQSKEIKDTHKPKKKGVVIADIMRKMKEK